MIFDTLPPGCPPSDARECLSRIFRLVSAQPIDASDFVSHFQLYPGRTWEDECMARGLSVFRSYEAAWRMRKRFKGFRGHGIASATFERPMGLIKQTGNPEHYTWWPEDWIDLLALFQLDPAEAQ